MLCVHTSCSQVCPCSCISTLTSCALQREEPESMPAADAAPPPWRTDSPSPAYPAELGFPAFSDPAPPPPPLPLGTEGTCSRCFLFFPPLAFLFLLGTLNRVSATSNQGGHTDYRIHRTIINIASVVLITIVTCFTITSILFIIRIKVHFISSICQASEWQEI